MKSRRSKNSWRSTNLHRWRGDAQSRSRWPTLFRRTGCKSPTSMNNPKVTFSARGYAEYLWLDRAKKNPRRYSLCDTQSARGREQQI
jgi:hypothetical protein